MSDSIAITGSGIICAIGTDTTSVRDALRKGRTGIGELQYLKSVHRELPVGEVQMSDATLKASLSIHPDEEVSRTVLLGAYALRQALRSSQLTPAMLKDRRVTFISATTVGGMDITERHYQEMLADTQTAKYFVQHDCGSISTAIASLCGIECELTTVSTACSSALNAIILGARMLLTQETDIVLAGGTEALSVFHLNGFNSLMILDHEICRPFDATRQGLNLGEGAAYVVLERTREAQLRQGCIMAFLSGWSNRCDAYHQTASSENGEGAYLAMNDALEMARLKPADIDYVNAHGTGTPNNDKSESTALCSVFGDSLPAISSTKSFTGHTTSASGSIETVICLIAMHDGFVPGNYGWKNSTPECIVPVAYPQEKEIHHAMCNSFGFGGNDSSLILSDRETVLEASCLKEYEIVGENGISHAEELKELRQYISPIESRRMCKLMKAAFLTSMRAMEAADITSPDAIIVATKYGMLENGEKILDTLTEQGEEGISPTLFMQSTHNTLAGALAIHLGCRGYNITYSQGDDSLSWAIRDAQRLISEGKAKTVLVGVHDEMPPEFMSLFQHHSGNLPEIYSRSMIIKRK